MKKVFGQTVRDIRREVNKKVLKVPPTERKVLDATSNEPWGPHGSLLADIAQASKNYHEYQMIMAIIWKRTNDTGKNWRHVYKALTVLEYLVAHGSERVIDEIREHTHQVSLDSASIYNVFSCDRHLFDFQYIDSSGRDQGSNVRRKSQSLVALVNDKEKIQEAREKAAANRDKYRNTSVGGMNKPGDRYDEDRYGSRDDGRNDYGREREWGNRDDDKYARYGDAYGHDGDRYGRDNDDRYGQDGYRDDDYQGRSQRQ
ncbi:Clathrin interactor EPSIN 2 [Forsythia ovata]|uniref:Clathrin interactor EPSIN 2 n=1 Tax=Forsythia ovata TaxID=205694 RepID=A0ABD1UYH3_9LAMI